MIFAVHPVEVESVAWITERKNVLSLSLAQVDDARLFPLRSARAGTGCATRRHRARGNAWYAAALVLFALAIFAKTVVVTLPAVLLVIYWWQRAARCSSRNVVRLLPFFALSIALGLMTTWMETDHVGHRAKSGTYRARCDCYCRAEHLWFYMAKLVLAASASPSSIRASRSMRMIRGNILFPLAAVAPFPVALWAARRRDRARAAGGGADLRGRDAADAGVFQYLLRPLRAGLGPFPISCQRGLDRAGRGRHHAQHRAGCARRPRRPGQGDRRRHARAAGPVCRFSRRTSITISKRCIAIRS